MNISIKNINHIILVIFLSFIICLGLLNISYSEEKFEIDVKVGFDGHVKRSELTPVRIEIKNNYKDVEGKIQFLVHDEYNKKNFYTAYSRKINIAKNSTKIIDMESVFHRNGLLYVRVLDKDNNVVFKKMVKYLTINRDEGMFMGILDENIDSLRYLSKAYNINYPKGSRESFFQIAELDDTLPENHITLKAFETIVINNYDSQKLNIRQREALKNWIEAGGLLLVGTGPNYQKTLKGLDNINFIDVKGTKEIMIENISSEEDMKIIDPVLKDGEEITIDNNKELKLYHKRIGKGHVVIAGFDLGLSPFVNWKEKDKFINQLINNYLNSNIKNYDEKYQMMGSHWFENIVSYLPQNLLPSARSILTILILFILLVGPINYYILKRIDRRELLWVTIPLIVIIFSSSIYVLGFRSKLRQPIVNNVSIIEIDDTTNTAVVNTRLGIMGFKNGTWDVTFDKSSNFLLQDRNQYDILRRFADEEVITEYLFDEDSHVLFNKASILDVENLTISNEIKLDGNIIPDIEIKDNKLLGSVNNSFEFDLEDVIIFYGDQYRKLGDLKAGKKSKEFQIAISKNKTTKNWYSIIDSIYGSSYQNNSTNSKNEGDDILNNNIKRDILRGVFDSEEFAVNNNRFFIIAWNRGETGKNIQINGKEVKRIDRNLIILPLDIEYKKGDRVQIPYGILYPEIQENNDMHIERNGTMLYGDGYVVLRFKPEDNIRLNSMEIDFDMMHESSKYDAITYIFNYEKNEWEKWNKNTIIIDDSNMNRYYQKERGALVKIDPEKGTNLSIPSFTIEGVQE